MFAPLHRWLLALLFLATAVSSPAQVVISEFLASNSNSIADEDGSFEDWLEIQNTSGATVNLLGYYLTDSSSEPRKWPLPAWTLANGNRLVIFASSKNRKPAQSVAGQDNPGTAALPRLHTNFKISTSAGNYLGLSKDDTGGTLTTTSSFTYPKQFADIPYGVGFTTNPLVAAGSPAKALVPTTGNGGSTLGATWRGAAGTEPFDDSTWQSGTLGAGLAGSLSAVQAANLKLWLQASTQAALTTDNSGLAHNGTNTSSTTTWVDVNTDTTASPLTRSGSLQFSAVSAAQVVVPASTDFNSTTGTIMFWMRSAGMSGGGSEGAMLWDRRNGSGNVLVLQTDGLLFSQPAGSTSFRSTVSVADNQWHHVAFVYNGAAGGTDTFYVDGVARGSVVHGAAWSWPVSQQIELGRSHDGYWYKYNGLLDDVRFYGTGLTATEVAAISDGADEAVKASDFGLNLASTLPGNAGVYVRTPFTLSDASTTQKLRLTTRASDGFVAYINGTLLDSLNAPATVVYNSLATKTSQPGRARTTDYTVPAGVLRNGTNILAVQGLNNTAADVNFLILPALSGLASDPTGNYLRTPTPGTINSDIRTDIGPLISKVTGDGTKDTNGVANFPARPAGGAGSASITVSATVAASLRPLATATPVQLAYRTMFGAETIVTMTAGAGGVYTAQVPTTGLSAGQMIRWRVIASDNTAIKSTAPAYTSTTDSDQYYGTVAVDGVSTQLPIYSVFVEGWTMGNTSPVDSDGGGRASFFYDGELYDNVFIRIKGDTTRTLNKRSHRIDFNHDHKFRWAAGVDRLRELALNAEYVDPTYSRQFMSMWLHRTSGTGAPYHIPVRAQMNGAFWQLAFHTDTQDSELLEYMGLDGDGALYTGIGQMGGAGGEKQTRPLESNADMGNFVSAVTNADLTVRAKNVFDQVDLPAVINYLAVARLTQEGDDVWANMDIYRDSDGTGEWRIIPFDTNLSWGQLYYADSPTTNNSISATDDNNKSHPLYGSSTCRPTTYATDRYNRFYDAIISVPATRTMLLRRIRSLMDQYLQAPGTANPLLEAQLDAHVARIAQEATLDRAKWGWPAVGGPYGLGNQDQATAVGQMKNLYITPRRTHFFNTHTSQTNVGISNSNSAGIPATPQAASFPMTIASYDANPTGVGKQDEEFIQITNPNSFAADISGWQITGGVSFTFKGGTVVNAGASVYVSPKQQVFRARATAPKGGQSLFVVGPYKGQLSARGSAIELRNAGGVIVTNVNTTAAPTAAQQQLRITELNFQPANPTAAELSAMQGITAGDFEFIELQNVGTTTLSLGGANFTEGITYTFPAGFTLAAGARIILAANPAAFAVRYGAGVAVAGTFTGSLDNSGETIELVDSVGEVVLSFRYESTWFPPAQGGGRTLVVRDTNPSYDRYNSPGNWALSGTVGGTPGAADADFANVYEGWRLDYFATADLPTASNPGLPAATTLDLDKDGLSNLSEYAYGRNPLLQDNQALTTPGEVTIGADRYLTITFTRRHKALDLTYVVEASSEVSAWAPVTQTVGTVVDLGNGLEKVTYRDDQPRGTNQRFLRVRAVK